MLKNQQGPTLSPAEFPRQPSGWRMPRPLWAWETGSGTEDEPLVAQFTRGQTLLTIKTPPPVS